MESTSKTVSANSMGHEHSEKYLTFNLGEVDYGIVITRVREIIGIMEITAVPDSPEYIKGVINLRGRVIPILDLRMKFGMEEKDYEDRTCIVVVDVHGTENTHHVGILVDSVAEVMNIASHDIEPPPDFGLEIAESSIIGIGKVKDRMKILLNVDHIIGKHLPHILSHSSAGLQTNTEA